MRHICNVLCLLLAVLLAVSCAVFAVSCSDDDDPLTADALEIEHEEKF